MNGIRNILDSWWENSDSALKILNGNGAAAPAVFSLPYSVDFSTQPDGALPADWTAPTWTIASGAAKNTPTLGQELVTNGTFEVDLTGWSAGASPDLLERNTTTPIDGLGDLHIQDNDNDDSYALGSAVSMGIGNHYLYSMIARKVGTRTATVGVGTSTATTFTSANLDGINSRNITTSNAFYSGILYAKANVSAYPKAVLNGEASNREIYMDDVSVKQLTPGSVFAKINHDLDAVSFIRAGFTLRAGARAGVFGWWDGVGGLQNCVVAWHDGTTIYLDKYVGALRTNLIALASTYVSGAIIEIRRGAGTNLFDLWYNGVQVSTAQTISDAAIISNKVFGLFSTDPLNTFTTVRVEAPDTLPVWDLDMTRYASNPVIQASTVGSTGTEAADPYLHVINSKLYIFFEATMAGSPEIGSNWMGESTDGITFSNFVKVSTGAEHYAHPVIYEEDGTIHLYMQRGVGLISHRSSPVVGFPDWSAEANVFDSATYGWVHMVEYEIFKHTDGRYYLLGITSNASNAQDKYIRGLYCATLPTNWNTQGTLITPNPMLNIDNYPPMANLIEITRLVSGGRLMFYFGVNSAAGASNQNVFEVTALSPTSFTGYWRAPLHAFAFRQAWENGKLHHAHAAYFNNQWVIAYDGGTYKIGTMTK